MKMPFHMTWVWISLSPHRNGSHYKKDKDVGKRVEHIENGVRKCHHALPPKEFSALDIGWRGIKIGA